MTNEPQGRGAVQTATQQQELPDRYVFHLDTFEGPLDLLLHLIEKRQLEITMISLVEVTDQYIAYLQQWEAEKLPLADMASFVSIAARLLFIKSQSLLPQLGRDDVQSEAAAAVTMAEELQRHLIEYKLAKEIAKALQQRNEAGLQTHARTGLVAGIETQLSWTPPTLVGLDVSMLSKTLKRLLEQRARNAASNEPTLVPRARVRVSERIEEIMSRLQSRPVIELTDIIENEQSRVVIVVTFIDVLELWKWQRIEVRQDDLMGPIFIERGTAWEQGGQVALDED